MTEPIVPIPEKFKLSQERDTLVISWQWNKLIGVILLVFSTFWFGILSVFYSQAFGPNGELGMLAVTSLHSAVGLGLIYYSICNFVNTTEVKVNRQQIQIRSFPLPFFFPRDKTVQSSELKQLFTKRIVRRTKNGTRVSFEVFAVTQTGHEKRILNGLENKQQALFIEKTIEKVLHIEDAPVHGGV